MFTFILDEHKFFDMMEDEKLMVSFDIPPMSFFLPEIRAIVCMCLYAMRAPSYMEKFSQDINQLMKRRRCIVYPASRFWKRSHDHWKGASYIFNFFPIHLMYVLLYALYMGSMMLRQHIFLRATSTNDVVLMSMSVYLQCSGGRNDWRVNLAHRCVYLPTKSYHQHAALFRDIPSVIGLV